MLVRVRYGVCAVLLLLLAGCGGMGGGDTIDETQPPPDLMRAPDAVPTPPATGTQDSHAPATQAPASAAH